MKNKIVLALLSVVVVASLVGCQQTDVIGKISKTSFAEVIKAMPKQVDKDDMNGGWSLSAPDNSAKFIWSKDYSKSPQHDVMIEFDAAPFVAAGLDVTKLADGIYFDDKIMLGTKLGKDEIKYTEEVTPIASFNKIVSLYRSSIGYHEALDHYGIDLGNGNKFEWAKDISKNDKDIVFVVDPETFVKAGVNPEKVEGWVYAAVEMMDHSGKPIKVMKFLKPFDVE